MTKKLFIVAALLLAASSTSAAPTWAADKHTLRTDWGLTPDTTMPHPKRHHLAAVAPVAMDLVMCRLDYGLGRSKDPDSAYPRLASGGKVKIALSVVSGEGTRRIARAKVKVTVEDNELFDNRSTVLGWADSAGDFWGFGEFEFRYNKNFPLHLEAGDMVLWIVQFQGMPAVESARDGDPWYQDGIGLGAVCRGCGSFATPCPDDW